MSQYAILSDLHGNLQALQEVHKDMKRFNIRGMILLGDLIDYGMQSNEVVDYLDREMNYEVLCNIWGNHEKAILISDFHGFSSRRGMNCAKYTASVLNEKTRTYLNMQLCHEGVYEFLLEGKRCMAVHGSEQDPFWKAISVDDVKGSYESYDFVFSGHSHISHMFMKFYEVNDLGMRNRHGVMFINPGSVGQPRNHHPEAQYAILDINTFAVNLRSVPYDITKAMSHYKDHIDSFYRERLKKGI